jgi:hypothetical protein
MPLLRSWSARSTEAREVLVRFQGVAPRPMMRLVSQRRCLRRETDSISVWAASTCARRVREAAGRSRRLSARTKASPRRTHLFSPEHHQIAISTTPTSGDAERCDFRAEDRIARLDARQHAAQPQEQPRGHDADDRGADERVKPSVDRIFVAPQIVERLAIDQHVARDKRRPRVPARREALAEQTGSEVERSERHSSAQHVSAHRYSRNRFDDPHRDATVGT